MADTRPRIPVLLLLAAMNASVAGALAAGSSAAPAGAGEALFCEDFDGPGRLADTWSGIGGATAERGPDTAAGSVGGGPDADARPAGVAGDALRIETPAGGMVCTKPLDPAPPFIRGERVRLCLRADDASAETPLHIEIRFPCRDRRAWWWRKVTLTAPGWQAVEAPLRYFRASEGAYPAWEDVNRFALYFRRQTTVWLDGIEVTRGTGEAPAVLSPADLAAIAFPGGRAVRSLPRDPFVLLTDSPDLDADATLDALEAMYGRLRADFPSWPRPARPAPLIVFATRDDYRAFWPRFGRLLNAEAPAPTAGGYSMMGIASSYYKPYEGGFRPVYPHEACHALLEQILGLASHGEWLHEAIANRCQMAVAGQDIRRLVRQGLDDASYRDPLGQLLNGKQIGMTRYWQAVSILEWLTHDEALNAKFLEAVRQMRRRGSTDLGPLAEPVFGMTPDQMDEAWRAWAERQLAGEHQDGEAGGRGGGARPDGGTP